MFSCLAIKIWKRRNEALYFFITVTLFVALMHIVYGGFIFKTKFVLQTRDITPKTGKKTCNINTYYGDHQPTWMDLNPQDMSLVELMEYFAWSNHSSCKLSHDFGGILWESIPMTSVRGYDGQKAVCIQPESVAPPVNKSCIVYSFGINYEWSFDDAMESYGCQVYAFDPSMDKEGERFDHSPGVHFYKIGLGAKDETPANGPVVHTLQSIRQLLGHQDRVIDYLKIDIEGSEWDVLPQLMGTGELTHVRQMGVEIHLPCCNSSTAAIQKAAGVLRTLERDFGMVRFDAKHNPWSLVNFTLMGNCEIPFCHEIAWYNSRFL